MSDKEAAKKAKKILKNMPKEQKDLNKWLIDNVPAELRNDRAARGVISTWMQRRQKAEKEELRRQGL